LLHLQEEAKANPSSVKSLEAQEEEITSLAKAVSLKHNTVIPKQWFQQNPLQYQGHFGLQPIPTTHPSGNSRSLNDHRSSLPACTTNSVHHNANPTANTNSTESPSLNTNAIDTSLQNNQAKSIAKVLPNHDGVKLFGELITKIKVTQRGSTGHQLCAHSMIKFHAQSKTNW